MLGYILLIYFNYLLYTQSPHMFFLLYAFLFYINNSLFFIYIPNSIHRYTLQTLNTFNVIIKVK